MRTNIFEEKSPNVAQLGEEVKDAERIKNLEEKGRKAMS